MRCGLRSHRCFLPLWSVPRAAERAHGGDGVLALPVEPETAVRFGPEPWLIRLDDPVSEIRYAAALIETWPLGGMEISGRRQRIRHGDIGVLYPRRAARGGRDGIA
jgi:hypothetical protein